MPPALRRWEPERLGPRQRRRVQPRAREGVVWRFFAEVVHTNRQGAVPSQVADQQVVAGQQSTRVVGLLAVGVWAATGGPGGPGPQAVAS